MTDTTPQSLSRRDMIATTAAALAVPLLPGTAVPALTTGLPKPRFFTGPEFALVDALTELIIPADDHSPGAHAAGVAAYIDGRLAESFEADEPAAWRAGLKAVDELSRSLNGQPFLAATAEQRVAVLTRMAAGEENPQTPQERFFRNLKGSTVRGYYTSKIGIHTDQEYKGNVYQTGEYAGFDAK